MPIYAYKCESCGFAKDVLQKMSDQPLVDCPQCGKPSFSKQVTAAGFQLKGSGWYVTDFRGGASTPAATASGSEGAKAESGDSSTKSDAATPAPPAAAAATPTTPASSAE